MVRECVGTSSLRRAVLVAALFALASGCGTHRGKDDDDDAMDAGPAGRGGTGGRSGSGGAGTGGTVAPPIACGNKQCTPLQSPFAGLALPGFPTPSACCLNSATGACGVQASAGAACEAPATPDTRCPGVNLGALGGLTGGAAVPGTMSGCCISNKCGLDGAAFGRGCVENAEAAAMLSAIPLVGSLITVPAARACDAPPTMDGGTDDDAGS